MIFTVEVTSRLTSYLINIVESDSISSWNGTLILAAIEPSIGYQKTQAGCFGGSLGSQHWDGALLGRLLLVLDRLSSLSCLIRSGFDLVLCKALWLQSVSHP